MKLISILLIILIIVLLPIFATHKSFFNIVGLNYQTAVLLFGFIPIYNKKVRLNIPSAQNSAISPLVLYYTFINSHPYFFLIKHIQVANYNLQSDIGKAGTLLQHFFKIAVDQYGKQRYGRNISNSYYFFENNKSDLLYYLKYTVVFNLLSIFILLISLFKGVLYARKKQKY